ncbi:unnamed protein product (macronuclear) [Paramecium tetraurelia]|uniref:Leucine Rich Repeat family protein n=1 Tax=Paramecium tetraurelia TaxID=5888 RepID=A0C2Q4_PARTE|nr:uncharacterized protein GSPATT00034549001 [Paramecium tetraurelia]CAK65071.1 unnamed protein product [Paramecium tetraurelia]|eukprot:XP_001432468.1 hypothetical protein (macronuclear) [Paramecium tetraurelia strain d4-2]
MKDEYAELTTIGTSSSSANRRLLFLHKSEITKSYIDQTKQICNQQKKKKQPFQKRYDQEQEKNESIEIQKGLMKVEILDWQGFMDQEQDMINKVNNEEEQQKTLKTPLTFKCKTNPCIKQIGNDRFNYFYKMKLANKQLSAISTQDFLKSVRHSQKLDDYTKLYKQQPHNLYMSLNFSQPERMPKTFGLIQNTLQLTNANVSHSLRNGEDCNAFSNAMLTQQSRQLQVMQLNHNQFTPNQLRNILLTFPTTLKDLELQNCKLNYMHMEVLMAFASKNQIYKLNLENNNIRDLGCQIIMKHLLTNNTLQCINLNNNHITECACNAISNLLKQTQRLLELYLGYNFLNGSAGTIIWKAMYKNTSIKILDLSHNTIASLECAQSINKAISRPYNELLHVDLSYNKFTSPQAQLISEALQKNETIYGFHFEGNQQELFVNPNGFLINSVQSFKQRQDKLQLLYKQPQYFKLLDEPKKENLLMKREEILIMPFSRSRKIRSTKLNKQNFNEINRLDTCWICEGWQEIKFEWTAHKSGSLYNEPIFIHFDFEEYRPLLMTFLNNEFFYVKMCPPNKEIHYFFTNPILSIQQPAMDQNIKQMNIQSIPFLYNDEILVDGNVMDQVNVYHKNDKQRLFDKYMPMVQCKPREPLAKFDFSPYLNIKKHCWSVENSIFKHFQPDTPSLIDECFEFDFQNSKVTRLVKDTELNEIKDNLKILYRQLFHCYKYHASGSLNTPIPCITIQDYIDFLLQTSLLDGYKTNDIDISFTSTAGAKDVQFPQAFDKGLVRCQLLEIMIRMCNDKFIRQGTCATMSEAICLINKQAQEYFSKFDQAQMWRKSRLWNQKCDIILSDRLAMLKSLFKYISRLSKKDKQLYKYDYISVQDFKDWIVQCKLICDDLSERECYLIYLQSMITQKDELYSTKHYQMNFHEFIEAIGRLAEKLSIIRGDKPLDVEDRRPFDLTSKIDGFLLLLYLIIGNDMKQALTTNDPDIRGLDKCMINDFKSLKQKLEDSFTDGDEPPYDPRVELPHLQSQITNLLGNTIGGKKQTLRQQLKQVKREEQKFSLINFVQYFKSIQQVHVDHDD